MQRVDVDDIRGIVGIIPTPSTPGADHWSATDTVDLDETARMVEAVVAGGIDVLCTNGTFGEASSLTLDELLAFNDVVVSTVAGRVPVFAGSTAMNTRESIARGRKLQGLGVDGLFLGRPMWLAMDDRQIVDHYGACAEAIPDLAIIAYDNASAFKGKISSPAYRALAEIPQIVASKHTGFGRIGIAFERDLRAVDGKIRLLPTCDDWFYSATLFPDTTLAAWSGDVACGPAPLVVLRNAILSRDWGAARAIHDELSWATETLFPNNDFETFMRYSIQIDRAEFESAGFITPGPARMPYTTAPETYLEGGREVGRRWARLQEKYLAVQGAGYVSVP